MTERARLKRTNINLTQQQHEKLTEMARQRGIATSELIRRIIDEYISREAETMTLKVQIPRDKEQIQRQIEALEYLLEQDKSEKDREIHEGAIEQLKKALEEL